MVMLEIQTDLALAMLVGQERGTVVVDDTRTSQITALPVLAVHHIRRIIGLAVSDSYHVHNLEVLLLRELGNDIAAQYQGIIERGRSKAEELKRITEFIENGITDIMLHIIIASRNQFTIGIVLDHTRNEQCGTHEIEITQVHAFVKQFQQ